MEFAWGVILFFSALTSTVFVSGESDKCYDVNTVFKGGECVDTIKITEKGDVWFTGLCEPPYHLYRLHEGNVSIVATSPGQIFYIDTDSKGRPYFTATVRDKPRIEYAYTIENGSLLRLSEDSTVGYLKVDKEDNVYLTSSIGVQRYKRNVGAEVVKGSEPYAHFYYEDSHGNDFFVVEGGKVWELKVDGTLREIEAGDTRKILPNPIGPGILIASDTGIHIVNGDSPTQIYNGYVHDAVLSKDGYLYVSTPNSSFVLKSGKITPIEGFQHRDTTRSVEKLYVDGQNNIYFLTEYVHVLRPNETTPQLVTGLPSKYEFRRVAFDSHDNALFPFFDDMTVYLYFLPANSLEARLVDEIKPSISYSSWNAATFYVGTQEGLYSITPKSCK